MTINYIIKSIMKAEKVTNARIGKALGNKPATWVTAKLFSQNMTFDKAIEILDILGYEVVVQKRTAGRRADGQHVVSKSVPKDKTKPMHSEDTAE